jgi:hypothetical protein
MITREEAKMFFDSDEEVLKTALDSDIEYAEATKKSISVLICKIFEILIQKGILEQNEALEHIKEVTEILGKEVENEKK